MYGQAKKRRQLLATDQGWDGFKALAAKMDLSASELVERIGRGAIAVQPKQWQGFLSIRAVGLSPRVVALLERAKIITVEDLEGFKPDDLLEINGLGATAQVEILQKCRQWMKHDPSYPYPTP